MLVFLLIKPFLRRPKRLYASLLQFQNQVAGALDDCVVMAREDDDTRLLGKLIHALSSLILKLRITRTYPLIHEKYLRFKACSNRKRQPRSHALAIGLERDIYEIAKFAERDNIFHPALDLLLAPAVDQTAQNNIAPARGFWAEAQHNIEKSIDMTVYGKMTAAGFVNPIKNLQ